MNYLYLLLNIGAISVPFLFSFHPRLLFFKKYKATALALFISALIFCVWDSYFTFLGVWGFNPKYLVGLYVFNLPLEEILFFVCIPYACLFTYHCFGVLIKKDFFLKIQTTITLTIILLLAIIGFLNFNKLYTFYTFIPLAFTLGLLKFWMKINWLGRFYFSFLVLLIPFTLINGVLTGTTIDEPVVWYNNLENLSLRILTIPIEDIFYGMLLILLNVALFEYFNKRFLKY